MLWYGFGRTLLAREHKRIRAEYEERVKQLEQERQGVEEERVQVRTQCQTSSITVELSTNPHPGFVLHPGSLLHPDLDSQTAWHGLLMAVMELPCVS